MSTVKPVKRTKSPKTVRQSRQKYADRVDAFKVITDCKTLARASRMVNALTDKARPGYLSLRDLSARTWRGRKGFGFWQHVAKKNRTVKLTWLDWKQLQSIYDLREAGVYANARLSQHVVAFQQYTALAMLEVVEVARAVKDTQRSE